MNLLLRTKSAGLWQVCIMKLPTHIVDIWKLHLHLSACKSIKTMLLGPLNDRTIEMNSF